MKKTVYDFMSEEKYNRVQELITEATEIKKSQPRKVAVKKPQTLEQKAAAAQNKIAKLQALLAELEAAQQA